MKCLLFTPQNKASIRLFLFLGILVEVVRGISHSDRPLDELLASYSDDIQKLRVLDKSLDDVALLRYCFIESEEERLELFQENMKWRQCEGKVLWETAQTAVKQATAKKGSWNNDAVLSRAPHSEAISEFLTPDNVITTTSSKGDLVYCIRAAAIDDVGLMKKLSVEQVTDFLIYVKLVNGFVANLRSRQSNQLIRVVTANDLKGVKILGGSSEFRSALSSSGTVVNRVLPGTAGPTLLMNLPTLMNGLTKVFAPLMPPSVSARIIFCKGPLIGVSSLRELVDSPIKLATFRKEIDKVLSKKAK